MAGAVVGVWTGCWGDWNGGVQASWVEEFGLSWWSVELRILGEVEMGSGEGFQVLLGDFGLVLAVEG